MKKGIFIAFEGIDGVGKSTLIDNLKDFLTSKQYKVCTAVQPSNEEILYIIEI